MGTSCISRKGGILEKGVDLEKGWGSMTPLTNYELWSLCNSLRSWNFRWNILNFGWSIYSPVVAGFDVEIMPEHLINCFEINLFMLIPESLISFKCMRSSHWEVFYKTTSVLQVFWRKKDASCSTPMIKKHIYEASF